MTRATNASDPHPTTVACTAADRSPPGVVAAEGEGDFFFDPASLQVAPGVNVHALLGGNTTAMEHAGEEHDDDEEDDDDEDGGYEGEGAEQQVGADVAELEVTGHRVALSSRGQPTTMEDEGGGEDVDLEHHDG